MLDLIVATAISSASLQASVSAGVTSLRAHIAASGNVAARSSNASASLLSSPTQPSLTNAKQSQPRFTLAQTTSEAAKSATAFVNSIGINTHIRYYDTAYGNYPFIKQSLLAVGIRHIRDGGSDPTWIQRINELGSLGIKATLVIDSNIGIGPNASYDIKPPGYTVVNFVKSLVPTGVEAVEVLNEFDLSYNLFSYTRSGQPVTATSWVSYLRDYTRDIYTALKADPATASIPVIGPSFVNATSSSTIGDLSQWVDYGSFHPYNNPKNPGDGSLAKDYTLRSQPFGNKPLLATEVGYSTGSPSSERPVSEAVQGKYIPRLFLESFNQGVPRTFSYELIDQKPNPNSSEQNFGILRSDGTPKPAYTALKNLISLLNDPTSGAARAQPGALNYAMGGNTQNVHHMLLQKSNGDFYLILWLEVPSTDQTATQTVTLAFSTPLAQAIAYAPNQSLNPVATFATPRQLTLGVTDSPLVLKLSAAIGG